MGYNYRTRAIRRLLENFEELDEDAQQEVIEQIRYGDALKAVREVDATKTVSFSELYDEAEKRQATFNRFEGFACGLKYFDDALMGFRPGELTIIAAASNTGKTLVSLNILASVITKSLKRGLIISMEMTKEEIASRIYNVSNISDHDTLKNNLFIQSKLKVNTKHIEIIIKKTKPDIVMIDVLQMLADQEKFTSEYERINAAVAKVKHIALKYNIPIILISHVAKTRSGEKGKITAGDLKGSSSIEQDSDQVILLNQNQAQRSLNELEVEIVKHRTKRPEVFHVPCTIQLDGIMIKNAGAYDVIY